MLMRTSVFGVMLVVMLLVGLPAVAQDDEMAPPEEPTTQAPDEVVEESPSPIPEPTLAPTATSVPVPTSTPTPGPGSVLLSDNFDDASVGVLPNTSVGTYRGGEYVFDIIDPTGSPLANARGNFRDASIAVDVRVVAGGTRYPNVNCRQQGSSSYRLLVNAEQGIWRLARFDRGTQVILVDFQQSSAIRPGAQTNRLELTCAGDLIQAVVNGTIVGSARDGTYAEGQMALGVGGPAGTADIRFDNLVVTQR